MICQQLIGFDIIHSILLEILNKINCMIDKLEYRYNSLYKKGKNCSINGCKYEIKIHNIIKNIKYNNNKFNIQTEADLAGSSSHNDIECLLDNTIIGIEAKKYNTPDWMQCCLKYNNGIWVGSPFGKIPEVSRNIFNKLLKNVILFNGNIPPFIKKKYTHKEWLLIKQNTTDWNDSYIDIPNDTIKNIYKAKG